MPKDETDASREPQGGRPPAQILNGLPGQAIRDFIKFAVDVSDGPVTPAMAQALAEVVAFLKEPAEVIPVTPPLARHKLDHEQGVQFKDQVRKRWFP